MTRVYSNRSKNGKNQYLLSIYTMGDILKSDLFIPHNNY